MNQPTENWSKSLAHHFGL